MADATAIKDRIQEFRRVPSAELLDNSRNWRVHPYAQTKAMTEILDTVGIADALIAYHSERNGGQLTLIDGHERKENHAADWPVLILDVTDEEADLLLLTHDPLAGLAEVDAGKLGALLQDASFSDVGLSDLLQSLAAQARAAAGGSAALEELMSGSAAAAGENTGGPPEMELQPFESYDYLCILFRNSIDWLQAQDLLGIEKVGFTLRDGARRKVGRGRVFDGAKFLAQFEKKKVV